MMTASSSGGNTHLEIIDSFFGRKYAESIQVKFYEWLLDEKDNEHKMQALQQKFESYDTCCVCNEYYINCTCSEGERVQQLFHSIINRDRE